jgi:hypothetical protein
MLCASSKTRGAGTGTRQGRRASRCLVLEGLEERVVPSLVNYVNFESGDFSQLATQTNAAIVTSPALDGTYSLALLRNNSVANAEIRASGVNYYDLPTAYCSFLFEYTSNVGDSSIVNFQDTASGYKASIHLSPSDQLKFFDQAGNLLATGTTVLLPGQVYTISAEVGTGTTASWEVLINGNAEISGTGNLGTTDNGSLLLGGDDAYTCTHYYDDVQISSQSDPHGGGAAVHGRPPAILLVGTVPGINLNLSATGTSPALAAVASLPHNPAVILSSPPLGSPSAGQGAIEMAKREAASITAIDSFFADWNRVLSSGFAL